MRRRQTARISSLLNSANALVNAFECEHAARTARRARDLARGCHHANYEARAVAIIRSVAYRMGDPMQVDMGFVNAVEALQLPEFEGVILQVEAAIGWRTHHPATQVLALRAHERWSRSGNRWGAALVSALGLAMGATLPGANATALTTLARACPLPRVSLQIMGLIAMAQRPIEDLSAAEVDVWAKSVPAHYQDLRLEVLSVTEAMDALKARLHR